MTDHAPAGTAQGSKDVIDQRTLAFVALGLGLVGALGGGVIGNALQWAIIRLFDSFEENLFTVLQGLIPLALGVAALVMGNVASRNREPVATPAGRTAMLFGAIAVVGGVLMVFVGLAEG